MLVLLEVHEEGIFAGEKAETEMILLKSQAYQMTLEDFPKKLEQQLKEHLKRCWKEISSDCSVSVTKKDKDGSVIRHFLWTGQMPYSPEVVPTFIVTIRRKV